MALFCAGEGSDLQNTTDAESGSDLMMPFDRSQPSSRHSLTK